MSLTAAAMCSLMACTQKSGDAIVLSKEHIAAIPATKEQAAQPEYWVVKVEMVSDLRKVDVRVEQARWDTVKAGDRLAVSYSQGKYTGTVWGSEIR